MFTYDKDDILIKSNINLNLKDTEKPFKDDSEYDDVITITASLKEGGEDIDLIYIDLIICEDVKYMVDMASELAHKISPKARIKFSSIQVDGL